MAAAPACFIARHARISAENTIRLCNGGNRKLE
jgi:hypothetical protein